MVKKRAVDARLLVYQLWAPEQDCADPADASRRRSCLHHPDTPDLTELGHSCVALRVQR